MDLRRVAVWLGLVLAGLWPAGQRCAWALDPALDISQYAHFAWKNSDGFAKGVIHSIAQTPDGYLWLGTEFGLLRFDGVQRVEWTPPDGQQLPSNYFRSLLVSRDGTLWIGTDKGLASWKDGRLKRYAELADQIINRLLEDREGAVWVSTYGSPAGRLCSIRGGSVQCWGEDGRFGRGVYSIYEHNGDLWAEADHDLWRWKPDPPRNYRLPGLAGHILDLIAGDNGALLMATAGGISQLVDGQAVPYPVSAGGQFIAERLFRDREGSLWIGTVGQGVLHVHQGRTDVFGPAEGLSGDTVFALFEDREGSIWVGTPDGLDRFRDFAVPTISVKQGVDRPVSVLATQDGSIWAGSGGGLVRWKSGQNVVYRKRPRRLLARPAQPEPRGAVYDDGLPANSVGSVFEDKRGRIWVSTVRGIAYLEDGRFHPVGSVASKNVYAIAEESPGNLFMFDENLGFFHLVDGRAEVVPWAGLGREDNIEALTADRVKGGLWIGFYRGGVARFQDGQVRATYDARSGLAEGRVNDFRLDRDGTLWAGTEGGLSRFKDGRWTTLTSRNGLPCDAVRWSLEDDRGSVWLSMPCGLIRVARAELDAWAADPSHRVQPTVFDSSDGVRSYAGVLGLSPRAAKSADGKIWFVSYPGVSVVDPAHIITNKLPPPVAIEKIVADRKDVTGRSRLPALSRELEIDYTALSFAAPEKVRFRYLLEGYDREWIDAGNRRQAFYTNLPPRHYRFRVMACNNSGVWNKAGAALDFAIAPAYYQTIWFRLACVAAFLAFLAALYYLRMQYLTHQFHLRLEERVGERTRIARELHDTLLQSFQGVLMKLSVLPFRLQDLPEVREALEKTIEQGRQAVTEGRDAVQGLRASTRVTNDLVRAITLHGEQLTADHAGPDCPEFRVRAQGESRDLTPVVRDEAHRIGCEALRNAFLHAQARTIEVEIQYGTLQFRLRVRDNGKGLNQKVLADGGRTGHHGLPGMKERAQLAGGKLTVSSRPNSGTQVELTIPASFAYARSAAPG